MPAADASEDPNSFNQYWKVSSPHCTTSSSGVSAAGQWVLLNCCAESGAVLSDKPTQAVRFPQTPRTSTGGFVSCQLGYDSHVEHDMRVVLQQPRRCG